MADFPWATGSATGVGSLPGTDIAEAQRLVLGELPDLPYLPELPDRGPGADMLGRSAGLLVDMPVQLYAGRWQVAPRSGRDLRRTADLMERDLDQAAAQGDGFAGTFKVQSAGPWTLVSGLDLPIGGLLLRDPGAVRDLTDSLAEGLRRHVAEVRKRLPRAHVILQLDEPALPAVIEGRVPTESGLSAYRAVDAIDAASALRTVIEAVDVPVVVHSCAPRVPMQVIRDAGAAAVGLDLMLLSAAGKAALDELGEALDAGLGLIAGAVASLPPSAGRGPTSKQIADRVRAVWQQLGFPITRLPQQVVVSPTCGLAGATPEYVRTVTKACRDAGRRLAEV